MMDCTFKRGAEISLSFLKSFGLVFCDSNEENNRRNDLANIPRVSGKWVGP